MEISQHDTRTRGELIASENGKEAGKLFYSWAGIDKLLINHTEVNPEFAHQGVGLALVKFAVDFARNRKVKVLPLCSFAKAEFKKHADWKDVLF